MIEVLTPHKVNIPSRYSTLFSSTKTVLVGVKAAAITLQWPSPQGMTELVIAPDRYNRIAQQSDWLEFGGMLINMNNPSFFLTDSYGGISHTELLQRGHRIEQGFVIASLPDIYTVMQNRGDTQETARIRQHLLDPNQLLLPAASLPREHAIVRSFMGMIPGVEDDPQYEAALQLATNALHTLFTLYGDPDIGRANQIVGSLEKPEYGVRALYHNAFEVEKDVKDLLGHLNTIGASTADKLDALVADLYADIIYGNGRESDNKKSFDELQSADLLYAHARQCNYPKKRAKRLHSIVLGTRFDEATKSQPGRIDDDPVVRAVAAADLQLLARPGAVRASQEITAENMMSRRKSKDRVLGKLLRDEGSIAYTVEEVMKFIYKHRNMPVNGGGITLGDIYAKNMRESADFHETYQPPADWTRDNPAQRKENAEKIRLHVQHFQQTGEMVL